MSLGSLLKRKHRKKFFQALRALKFTVVEGDDDCRHVLIPPSSEEAAWWHYGNDRIVVYKPKGKDVTPEQVHSLRRSLEGCFGWNATTFKLEKPDATPQASGDPPSKATVEANAPLNNSVLDAVKRTRSKAAVEVNSVLDAVKRTRSKAAVEVNSVLDAVKTTRSKATVEVNSVLDAVKTTRSKATIEANAPLNNSVLDAVKRTRSKAAVEVNSVRDTVKRRPKKP
ncbi:hypothetical protein C8Q76DRAFT_795100 [Earliella scabrosa]|nr:hypothetical protein C8Q76DRAFT_795100 [Earliella scabrosa]